MNWYPQPSYDTRRSLMLLITPAVTYDTSSIRARTLRVVLIPTMVIVFMNLQHLMYGLVCIQSQAERCRHKDNMDHLF